MKLRAFKWHVYKYFDYIDKKADVATRSRLILCKQTVLIDFNVVIFNPLAEMNMGISVAKLSCCYFAFLGFNGCRSQN